MRVVEVLLGCAGAGLTVLVAAFLLSWRDYRLRGKHVVVTGGSKGIGLALAKQCASEGAKVTVVARSAGPLKQAAKEVRAAVTKAIGAGGEGDNEDGNVMTVSLDVGSTQEEVSEKLGEAIDAMGPVDVLLNCAGTSIAHSVLNTPPGEYERMMRVNYLGSVFPTRAVLPSMLERGGRIVFVSSQAAQAAIWGYTAYSASKRAITAFAEALQMEVRPHNIFVTVSYPPDTDTPGYAEEMETKPHVTAALCENLQLAKAEDVAQALIADMKAGRFASSVGIDGIVMNYICAGMAPVNSFWDTLMQLLFSGIGRIAAPATMLFFDATVRKVAEPLDQPDRAYKDTPGAKSKSD